MNSPTTIAPSPTHRLKYWVAHTAVALGIIVATSLMAFSLIYSVDIAPRYSEGIRYAEGKGPAYSYASVHWKQCGSLFNPPASCAEKTINEAKAEQGDKFKQEVEDALVDIIKHSKP